MYKNTNTLLDLNSPFFNYQDIYSQNLFLLDALSPLHLGTNTQNLSFKSSQSDSAEPEFISAEPTDIPGDLTTTAFLTDGIPFTGMVSDFGDEDWFQFTVDDDQIVRFTIMSADARNFRMYLMDSSGVDISGRNQTSSDISTRYTTDLISDAGTYFVNVHLSGGIGTEYTVTFDKITNDIAGNTSSSATLNIGSTFSSDVDYVNDRDWIAVELDADQAVYFKVTGTFGPTMNLMDSSGNSVFNSYTSSIIASVDTSGTYYLNVGGSFGYSDYTITSTILDDDYGKDTNTLGKAILNGTVTGVRNYKLDTDWFRIDITEAGVLQVITTVEGRPGNPMLGLYDANGNAVRTPSIRDNFAILIETPGIYYISTQSIFAPVIEYALTTELIVDVAGDITTSEILDVNATFTNYFDTGTDHDWYAFTVEAGNSLITRISSSVASTITLRDINGVEIAHIDVGYNDATALEHAFSEGGTYYLDYTPQTGANPGLIPDQYDVYYAIFGPDLAADTNTTDSISIDTSVLSILKQPGDRDWMSFTASEGQVLQFILSSPRYTTHNATLRIYDQNGMLLDITDAADTDEDDRYINFTATESGQYFIEIDGNTLSNDFIDYTLTLTAPSDDFTQAADTAGQITTTTPATGVFDYLGDEDWFAITVNAGDIFRFESENAHENSFYYPALSLYDSDGNEIILINSHISPHVFDFAFNVAGTYYVGASGADTAADLALSPYTLTMTALEDDYLATVNTIGHLIVDGASSSGANHFEGDEDWFSFSVAENGSLLTFAIISDLVEGNTPDWSIYDDEGTLVSTLSQNTGTAAFQAIRAGNYFLSLQFDSSNINNLPANYTLSAITVIDDHTGNTSTTTNITAFTSISGQIDHRYDSDWFAIEVSANETLSFAIARDGGNSLILPRIHLRNSDGDIIDSARQNTQNIYTGLLSHTFETSGTYYVSISGSLATNYAQSYNLIVEPSIPVLPDYAGISGSLLDDILRGSDADDSLNGLEGNDTFYGEGGDDLLYGSTGSNYLDGGSGTDTAYYDYNNAQIYLIVMDNMDGTYTVHYTPSPSYVNIHRGSTDTLVNIEVISIGGIEYDITEIAQTVVFSDVGDIARGSDFHDYFDALGGNDVIFGAGGTDIIYGRGGEDQLYGGSGNDQIYGGTGNDIIYGGEGDDRLYGEEGADIFVINAGSAYDMIMDFENGIDRLLFTQDAYDYAQLKIYQDGNNVIIASSNGVTTLMDTDIADIDASDFIFRVSADADKSQAFDQEQFAEFLASPTALSPASMETENDINVDMTIAAGDSYFDIA